MLAKLILLGVLQVTSYRAVPEQTKPECLNNCQCFTSIGEAVRKGGIAVSQDLLKAGIVKYGDYIFVEGYGLFQVNDTMHERIKNAIDIFVRTYPEEKAIGVQHCKVYLLTMVG